MRSFLALCLFAVVALAARPAAADQFIWIRFYAGFSYRDFAMACNSQIANDMYLRATLNNGQLTGILIKEGELAAVPGAPFIELTPDEVAGTAFSVDSAGHFWLTGLTLDARIVNWLFNNIGGDCRPREFTAVTPAREVVPFSTPAMGAWEVLESTTGKISLEGTAAQFGPFSADLVMKQTQLGAPALWPDKR